MLVAAGILMNEKSAVTESYIAEFSDEAWKSLKESVSAIHVGIDLKSANLIRELPGKSSIQEVAGYSSQMLSIYDALAGMIKNDKTKNDKNDKEGLASLSEDSIREDVRRLVYIADLTSGMGNNVSNNITLQTIKENSAGNRRHSEVAKALLLDSAEFVRLLREHESDETKELRYSLEDALSYENYLKAANKEQYISDLSHSRIAHIPLLIDKIKIVKEVLSKSMVVSLDQYKTSEDLSAEVYEAINSAILPKIKKLHIDYISDAVNAAIVI